MCVGAVLAYETAPHTLLDYYIVPIVPQVGGLFPTEPAGEPLHFGVLAQVLPGLPGCLCAGIASARNGTYGRLGRGAQDSACYFHPGADPGDHITT